MIEHGQPPAAAPEKIVLVNGQPKVEVVQVFPIACDADSGWWQVNLDAPAGWLTEPVCVASPGVSAEHEAAEHELRIHSIPLVRVPVVHSMSWRSERFESVYHYFTVIDMGNRDVLEEFPDATPIHPELGQWVGQPRRHGAAEPPRRIRYTDIVRHGIRTLWGHCDPEFLTYDANIAAALPPVCLPHLRGLRPAIADMFGPLIEAA